MRNAACGAAVLAMMIGGCRWPQRRAARPQLDVRPLSEAGFDIFVGQIAEDLSRVLRETGISHPIVLRRVVFDGGGVELVSTAGDFTRALMTGLTDRMAGRVRFGPPADGDPPWRAYLRFSRDPETSRYRTVTFWLIDEETDERLLAHSYRYGGPRSGVAPPPPDSDGVATLRIDYAGDDLGEYVLTRLPQDERRLIRGGRGAVAFLRARDARTFRVESQRLLRMQGRLPRAEVDIIAEERPRDARLRAVFFDDEQRCVGSSPVIPYRFLSDLSKTVVLRAPDVRATRYVVLFASE
ncbi:MAG: hypothetical protein D6744_02555 [Planctomycetota bacterium]|nr:MAG: hypothetical protein D6744_02555 [Planctomycetota bacterium]